MKEKDNHFRLRKIDKVDKHKKDTEHWFWGDKHLGKKS